MNRANGILSKLKYNVPSDICSQVYYAIFYSYLIYGLNDWGFTNDENINEIQVNLGGGYTRNSSTNFKTNVWEYWFFSPYYSNVDQMFIELKLLKVR